MYLQKSVQYHRGDFVEQDKEGSLFKGIVVSMIVFLKKFLPIVIRSLSETKINGESLIQLLSENWIQNSCCYYRWPSFNVNAFTRQHGPFNGDNKTFIKHPAHADLATKTYLFFDVTNLFKKNRKQSAKSKEICVSVVSIWFVS